MNERANAFNAKYQRTIAPEENENKNKVKSRIMCFLYAISRIRGDRKMEKLAESSKQAEKWLMSFRAARF